MADAFVSYSRRDRGFVDRLFKALEGRGRDLWVDWEDIPPTADWQAQIRTGIEEANDFIFVVSPDSIASEVCATELGIAEELNKRIVPLLVREVDPSAAPPAVARANWIFFDDAERFDAAVETLIDALDTDLDYVNAHTRLLVAAERWQREERDRSLLIRGSELTAATAWLDAATTGDRRPEPLTLQAEFVRASREATARRQRITVAAVSVALVVAIALAVVALVQRSNAIDQRNAATARGLDAQAQNQYDTDPELSVLLAIEAAETDPGDSTEEALRRAMERSKTLATYHSPRGAPENALFSPRGDALLVADGDDTARIRRIGDAGPPIELEAPGLSFQIAWSADGRAVATGAAHPAVWDARTGQRIAELPVDAPAAWIALDTHATRAVTIDPDGDGHVFSVASGRELATFKAPPAAHPLITEFDASDDLSVVAEVIQTGRTELFVWDGTTGRTLYGDEVPFVQGLDVAPDGKLVGTASLPHGGRLQGEISVTTPTGEAVYSSNDRGTAIQLSPVHANRFAVGTLPSLATLINSRSGLSLPLSGHVDAVDALDYGLGDARLLTGSQDDTARLWDTGSGEQLELLSGHRDQVSSVSYSAEGTLAATTSPDGDTRVWTTDKPLPDQSVSHPTGAPAVLAPDPGDGAELLFVGPGPEARIMDAETLRSAGAVPLPSGPDALGADWAADASLVAIATARPDGVLYSIVTAAPDDLDSTQEIRPGDGLGAAAAVSGGRLFTVSSTGELELWNGLTGESIRKYDVDAGSAAIAVDDAGDLVGLLTPDGTITVLDVETGETVQTMDGPAARLQTGGIPGPYGLIFDPGGERVATYGADLNVRIWSADSGELMQTLKGGEGFFGSVGWSPDGARVAGGDANGVYVWDADSGAVLQHLQHSDPGTFGTTYLGALGVRTGFSLDGQTVLSAGNGTVSLWSADTGEQMFHNPFASAGALSADGRSVYTAGSTSIDRYTCTLCGDLDQLLSNARGSVTRGLTEAERERYLGG
jgi:WD40 repeat protein